MALENMGLTALDPRVAAVEQFVQQKQIPVEQVPDFLLSMGADPRLAGLVMKYQRLKAAAFQPQQGPVPTTTVAQDVQNAEMQKAMEVQQILAAQQLAAQRATGIGQLPAPVMDNARFAGGGIVAFQGGGAAYAPYPNRDIENIAKEKFKSLGSVIAQGPLAQALYERRDKEWETLPQKERARYRAQAAAEYNSFNPVAEVAESVGRQLSPSNLAPSTSAAIRDYITGAPSQMPKRGATPEESGAIDRNLLWEQAKGLGNIGMGVVTDVLRPFGPVVDYAKGFLGLGGEEQPTNIPLEEIDVDAIRNLRRTPPPSPPAPQAQPSGTAIPVGIPSLPRARSLNDAIAEIEALQKERGIGNWTQDAEKMIAARLAEDKADMKKDRYMALAEAGFKMAEAASRSGAKFLGSAGVGGQSYAQSVIAQNKATKEAIRAADQQRIALKQAQDQLNQGNINTAIKIVEEDKTRVHEASLNAAKIAADRFEAELRSRVDNAQLAAMDKQMFMRAIGDAQDAYATGISNLPSLYINWSKLKPNEQQEAMDTVYNQTFGMLFKLFPNFVNLPGKAIGFRSVAPQ